MSETETARYQWSIKMGNGEIFVVRADPNESEDAFFGRVDSFKKKIDEKYPPAAASPNYVAPAQQQAGGAGSFTIESLEFAGKERWIAKGGNYKKFGVTVFKEVLVLAGIFDKLSMEKVNTPQGGYIAHYTERVKEDGKTAPDKIFKIEKVG